MGAYLCLCVFVCVCWLQPWAVLEQPNQLRCRLGCGLLRNHLLGVESPRRRGSFGGGRPLPLMQPFVKILWSWSLVTVSVLIAQSLEETSWTPTYHMAEEDWYSFTVSLQWIHSAFRPHIHGKLGNQKGQGKVDILHVIGEMVHALLPVWRVKILLYWCGILTAGG